MKLFVADAKYRGLDLAYDTTKQAHGNPQLSVTTAYFNGSADSADTDKAALTYARDDAWIQSTYAALKDDGTAKSNTDFLMKVGTTAAAHWCRKQNISGVGQLDLPNLYELIILYLESDNIDALDPTVASNRDKALGKMNTYGRFDFGDSNVVWSSTENSTDNAWHILCAGHAWANDQRQNRGVIPVKEL